MPEELVAPTGPKEPLPQRKYEYGAPHGGAWSTEVEMAFTIMEGGNHPRTVEELEKASGRENFDNYKIATIANKPPFVKKKIGKGWSKEISVDPKQIGALFPKNAWPAIKWMLRNGYPFRGTTAKQLGFAYTKGSSKPAGGVTKHYRSYSAIPALLDIYQGIGSTNWAAQNHRPRLVQKVPNPGQAVAKPGKTLPRAYQITPKYEDMLRTLTGIHKRPGYGHVPVGGGTYIDTRNGTKYTLTTYSQNQLIGGKLTFREGDSDDRVHPSRAIFETHFRPYVPPEERHRPAVGAVYGRGENKLKVMKIRRSGKIWFKHLG